MKILLSILLLISSSFASASDVTSLINSNGELVINVIDHPGETPYEATLIWSTMLGSELRKEVISSTFTLKCVTTLSAPLNERFGTCRIKLSKERLNHGKGYFGGIISDKNVLASFSDANLRLADGKLLFTIDHNLKLLGIKIDENLVQRE